MQVRLFCLAVICGILALSSPAGAVNYTVTDLGTLEGGNSSNAYGINNTGQVAGTSYSSSGARAFLYDNGTMTDLGTLPGGDSSFAHGINDAGQVVGISGPSSGYYLYRAFLYDNGTMTDLGTLPEGKNSWAYGINDTGQVVGYSDSSLGDRSFLYDNGEMTDLGTLPGDTYSWAYGINNAGQVVGQSSQSGYSYRGFLYTDGTMTDLGTLPGSGGSYAYGVNNAGQVVGISAHRAFLYDNGTMIDLGKFPGDDFTIAFGINDKGQVVGQSDGPSGDRAFLYDNGTMTDLNSLIVKGSFTGTIVDASGINNMGQISGTASIGIGGDQEHAVLLSPVPDKELTVTKTGTGSGTIVASGLSCVGNTCTGTYGYGDIVQITATPATGSVFGEWTGCDSVVSNVCTVNIISDKSISASFYLEYTLAVTLEGTGDGRVLSTPSGIDCEPTCSQTFVVGTNIRLSAKPYGGSVFAYWSGACTGTMDTCDLTMTDYIGVTAHFTSANTKEYALKVKRTKKNKGDGVVTSNDGNITCGATCSYKYYKDTVITLSAEANETSTFLGWKPESPTCTGTDPCTVTIDKAKTVQAIFVGDYTLKVTSQSKKKGTGLVSSTPSGISCFTGSKVGCAATYSYAQPVTLSVSPDSGSTFLGWTPKKLCPGTDVCIVPMDKKRSIKAVFGGK